MNPMLASDAVESKIIFPCFVQPKIDGVRALNETGTLVGRSLKKHKNVYTTTFYSLPEFVGFDGELAAAHECDPNLCRITSSAVGTIKGSPFTLWWLFDYVTDETRRLSYSIRYNLLMDKFFALQSKSIPQAFNLRVVPSVRCASIVRLLEVEQMFLDKGYEGLIIRHPDLPHKSGRSTVGEGGLLRIKRFIEEEAEVLEIIEGEANSNEAQINELGLTFRSSHQDNMVPNGMVGAMICRDIKSGEIVRVGAGRMPHDDRIRYFENPSLLLKKIIKYKHFPKGVKDKPRFPTFQCLKLESDMP